MNGLPNGVRNIAWKAQTRLCDGYSRLRVKGNRGTVVVTPIARKMSAFLWAVEQQLALY